MARQRWFGGKSRPITGTRIEDWAVFNQGVSALVLVEVQYAEGECDTYLVTLGLLFGKAADALREESPNALLARVVPRQRRACSTKQSLTTAPAKRCWR